MLLSDWKEAKGIAKAYARKSPAIPAEGKVVGLPF